jgi:hypothetical protein
MGSTDWGPRARVHLLGVGFLGELHDVHTHVEHVGSLGAALHHLGRRLARCSCVVQRLIEGGGIEGGVIVE